MKRILLLYFSGTDNTLLCAKKLQKYFLEKGNRCDIYRFSYPLKELPKPQDYDLLGVGYPIHAFNTPLSFLNFLKHDLPNAQKPYFIFKVSGEPFHFNDASSSRLIRILKKKGYRCLGEKHFLMPYNIIFRYPDSLAKGMLLYLDSLSCLYVQELSQNETREPRFSFFSHFVSFIFRIEWLAPIANSKFVKVDTKKCRHCGLCLASCPNNALYYDEKGRIRINNRCSICMRCADFCPVDAFCFGFLNHWKVVGKYNYARLLSDPSISPSFGVEERKGYFRHFLPYFERENKELLVHGIPLPFSEDKENSSNS